MVTELNFPHGNGRDGVLFILFHVYHGRDGARTTRRSHHGRDNSRKMKNTLIHGASRPWGEGKQVAVAVTANGHGHDHVLLAHHGRD